eukprot:8151395-Lingulodinium_polyedra.AAC.1
MGRLVGDEEHPHVRAPLREAARDAHHLEERAEGVQRRVAEQAEVARAPPVESARELLGTGGRSPQLVRRVE